MDNNFNETFNYVYTKTEGVNTKSLLRDLYDAHYKDLISMHVEFLIYKGYDTDEIKREITQQYGHVVSGHIIKNILAEALAGVQYN